MPPGLASIKLAANIARALAFSPGSVQRRGTGFSSASGRLTYRQTGSIHPDWSSREDLLGTAYDKALAVSTMLLTSAVRLSPFAMLFPDIHFSVKLSGIPSQSCGQDRRVWSLRLFAVALASMICLGDIHATPTLCRNVFPHGVFSTMV